MTVKKNKGETCREAFGREIEYSEETGEILGQRTVRMVEVVEDFIDTKLPKKHRLNNGNFITVFQEALLDVVINGNLSKGEAKLLLYLLSKASTFGSVDLTLNELVSDLKEKKPNIIVSLRGLVERNIVIKKTTNFNKKQSQPNYYELSLNIDRLNYNLAWNGKIKSYKEVIHKDPRINQLDIFGGKTEVRHLTK